MLANEINVCYISRIDKDGFLGTILKIRQEEEEI